MTPNPQDSAVALEVERDNMFTPGHADFEARQVFRAPIVGSWPWLRGCINGITKRIEHGTTYVRLDEVLDWLEEGERRASQSDGTSGGWHTCEESSECTACDLQSPAGWRLVPVTPTKEMIEAAMHVKRVRLLEAVAQIRAGMDETEARTPAIVGEWEAMLAAAPKKSQGENHVG